MTLLLENEKQKYENLVIHMELDFEDSKNERNEE